MIDWLIGCSFTSVACSGRILMNFDDELPCFVLNQHAFPDILRASSQNQQSKEDMPLT